MKKRWQYLPGALLLLLGSLPLMGQVTIPNTFVAGDKASAAQVNANFEALKDVVEALQARVQQLEEELQSGLAQLEVDVQMLSDDVQVLAANDVLGLEGSVALVTDNNGYQTVLFSGVNVQIINGMGQTTPNGVGNLIVGYNSARTAGWPGCSAGQFGDATSCQNAGHIWAINHKTGSHNLVVGNAHAYSQTGSFVAGFNNSVNRNYAAISGGQRNLATGEASSVSGGYLNQALSPNSSVLGGRDNGTAPQAGQFATVVGGEGNGALGNYSVVLGGQNNIANAMHSVVP